jgi:putative ABC transport system permease protein
VQRWWNHLKALIYRRRQQQDLYDEFSAHLQMDAQERMESGLAPEEARHAARRDFGSVLLAAEDTRATWGWITFEQSLEDLRYGLRSLWNRPAFTGIAVLTLGLGIGASTTIFSIVSAALLRPLPYPTPDRLVAIHSVNQTQGGTPSIVSPADFRDWREQARSFQHVAGYSAADLLQAWIDERPETIPVARVTWNFFRTFGVTPSLGNGFEESDEVNSAPGSMNIMLSHRMWLARFGGNATVVGSKIRTTFGAATVVGIMPPEFRFPDYAEIWMPMGSAEMTRRTRYWRVVGRLQDDTSVDAAQRELESIAAGLAELYPKDNRNWSVRVTPFAQDLVRDVRQALWILMGAVTFVVLIACANVAGLMLVRSASRRREMAVRLALGAGRSRLVRQLFVEGLLVSLASTAAGLLLARWSIEAFFQLLPQTSWIPLVRFRDGVQLDGAVLVFTILISALTAVVLTLTPVADSLKLALAESIRPGTGKLQSAREHRVYKLLVVAQFACAIVLLAGAGLLIQSFVRMLNVENGYDPRGLVSMGFPQPAQNREAFIDEALQRIKVASGVEAAALMSTPRFGQLNFPINIEDRPLLNGDVVVRYSSVTADYFRVLNLRLLAGRVFDIRDSADASAVVMINERLAREYFSGEDPIGRKIVLAYNNQRTPREIVGVVSNVRQDGPREPVRPEVLVPWPQAPWLAATLIIRATGDSGAVQRAVREAIWSVDRNLPAYPAQTIDEALSSQVATPRLYMILFGVFSALAVALAALGIYGLLAHIVGRRTSELAIRVALGARRSTIVRLIVGEGIRLSVAGIVLGLLGTIVLTRLMRSLLFEVSPHDPLTFAGVAIVLLVVAFTACYIPARRAARTDPATALRHE